MYIKSVIEKFQYEYNISSCCYLEIDSLWQHTEGRDWEKSIACDNIPRGVTGKNRKSILERKNLFENNTIFLLINKTWQTIRYTLVRNIDPPLNINTWNTVHVWEAILDNNVQQVTFVMPLSGKAGTTKAGSRLNTIKSPGTRASFARYVHVFFFYLKAPCSP